MPTEPQHTEGEEEGRPKANFCTKTAEEPSKENQPGEGKYVAWTKIFCPGGGYFILLTLCHLFVIQWAIKIPWRAGGMGGGLMWEKLKAVKTGRQNSAWMWLAERMSPRRENAGKNLHHTLCFWFVCFRFERKYVCKKGHSATKTNNYTHLRLCSIYKRHFTWLMTCEWQREYKTSDWRRSSITHAVCLSPHMLSANLWGESDKTCRCPMAISAKKKETCSSVSWGDALCKAAVNYIAEKILTACLNVEWPLSCKIA